MFKNSFLLLVSLLFTMQISSQELISYTKVSSLNKKDLKEAWKENGMPTIIININNNFDLYELIYSTKWHDGTTINASGLYFAPTNMSDAIPQLIYHHGTKIKVERTNSIYREKAICAGFAADGYAVIMPDYIGLGKGEKTHLYQHAQSESDAAIDMYFAVQELNKSIALKTNNQLYLTGYSQGGHACLATHKRLQEDYPEIAITASSPMSGAYHMSGAQADVMFSPYKDPAYLPYLLMTYNEVYNITGDSYLDLFVAPYDTLIPTLYKGHLDLFQINDYLPEIPVDMVQPDLVEQYLNNPNFKFRLALEENNLIDWKTDTPTQFCYCTEDKRVLKENSFIAYETMLKNGSTNLSLRKAGNKVDHIECAGYAFVYTKLWFNSFKKGSKKGRRGNIFKRLALSIKKAL
jgi:pimeloyl-ACP methyl ester carboxylesterase